MSNQPTTKKKNENVTHPLRFMFDLHVLDVLFLIELLQNQQPVIGILRGAEKEKVLRNRLSISWEL